jgi:hypothetical protein
MALSLQIANLRYGNSMFVFTIMLGHLGRQMYDSILPQHVNRQGLVVSADNGLLGMGA